MSTRVHQPSDACRDSHCYSHGVDEQIARDGVPIPSYLTCGECFHAFPTARHLRRDARRGGIRVMWDEFLHPFPFPTFPSDDFATLIGPWMKAPRHPRLRALRGLLRWMFIRARDVEFCPHCIHDL